LIAGSIYFKNENIYLSNISNIHDILKFQLNILLLFLITLSIKSKYD